MKTRRILIGVLIAGASQAQTRMVQPQGPIAPQTAKILNASDMQLSVLKQQIALLQEKQAKQQEEIANLQYCLGAVRKELQAVEHPDPDASSVTVQQKSIYATDACP